MTWQRGDSALVVNRDASLTFTVARPDGRPAVLEPYMGMAGHAMIARDDGARSEEHTSELQSRLHLVCRLLLEKKKTRRSKKNTKSLIASRVRVNQDERLAA